MRSTSLIIITSHHVMSSIIPHDMCRMDKVIQYHVMITERIDTQRKRERVIQYHPQSSGHVMRIRWTEPSNQREDTERES
eukprot:scaffold14709_cov268-Ochromonas_danica.AAC.11